MDTALEVRDEGGRVVTEGEGQVFIGEEGYSHTHTYTRTHTHTHTTVSGTTSNHNID